MTATEKTDYTLLHVEDSPEIQQLVRHILTSRPNIKVCGALTVEAGINLARLNRPDLVLMDILLPDGNGLDALKRLRASDETIHIPVVALSSLDTQAQIEEGLREGFQYYITKPIDIPEFLETVDQILDNTS